MPRELLTPDNNHLSRPTMVTGEGNQSIDHQPGARFCAVNCTRGQSPQVSAVNCTDCASQEVSAVNCTEIPSMDVLKLVAESISPNTRRAYQSDLAQFQAWGGSIPASPATVASYLVGTAVEKSATVAAG